MTIIKSTTKKGRNMMVSASRHEGFRLWDVYDTFSNAKSRAWDYCYEKCLAENGECFGICSHNTFGFTVSWYVENGMRIETPKNSYLILSPEYC